MDLKINESTFDRKRKEDLAIADYTQALRINHDYAEAYYNRGSAYHRIGQDDLAIADFTEALRINPDYSEGLQQPRYFVCVQ